MYRILLVDDEEDIRRGMARSIPWESWGFEVIGQAENGEEAVRILEEKKPDVVLSDIRMPKMDGIELMQYLYANHPEMKIIILSGYNDVDYLGMAIKNRVTQYLLKPTDIDEFEALFRKLKDSLDEEARKQKELKHLKETARQGQELSCDIVLNNLLDGYVGDQEEYERKKEMEQAGMNFSHCVMVVLDTPDGKKQDGDDQYRLKQKIIRYCNSRQMPWQKIFFLHRGQKVVGLITLKEEEPETAEQIRQCVEEIQLEIGDIYGLDFRAGISPLCEDVRCLSELYKKTEETVSTNAPNLLANQKMSSLLVASIKEYLDECYCSNMVSLDSAAERFRKNPAYISKVFKKETGFNFSDYITQKRMEKSKLLLRDMSLKIYEIAEMTGYADSSNFIKVFKKNCGISPNEYRSLY